jgi:hypothetical protein
MNSHALWALIASGGILVLAGASMAAPLLPGGRFKGALVGISVVAVVLMLAFFFFAMSTQPHFCAEGQNC